MDVIVITKKKPDGNIVYIFRSFDMSIKLRIKSHCTAALQVKQHRQVKSRIGINNVNVTLGNVKSLVDLIGRRLEVAQY